MKMEYKILWVDDNPNMVRGDIKRIDAFLDNYGISLNSRAFTVSPDRNPLKDEGFLSIISDINLDMVFVDLNILNPVDDEDKKKQVTGADVIRYIRRTLSYYHLPIVFYSSSSVLELSDKITELNKGSTLHEWVDGVYFCDREHLFDKTHHILSSLLKKESQPQQVRGLLVSKVSEIDICITEITQKIWGEINCKEQIKVIKELESKLTKKKTWMIDTAEKLEIKNEDNAACWDYYLAEVLEKLDTHARAEILRYTLKYTDAYKENGKKLSSFYNNPSVGEKFNCLNALRNDYAHKRTEDLKEKHSEELCKHIRCESRQQLENLQTILDGLSKKQ